MGTAPRALLWITLGAWMGGLALFAVGVAPLAFARLPPGEAAKIVAPILAGLNFYGVAAGPVLAGLAWRADRGRVAIALPLVLAAVCAFSELWVTAGISDVRSNAFGPRVTEDAALRFSFLHQLSRVLYFGVAVGTVGLAVWHARIDAAAARENGRKD